MLACCALALSCATPTADLFVDLRSDYGPGTEIVRVETRLELTEGLERTASFDVDTETDLAGGVRVAMFDELEHGSYRLELDAFGSDGAVVASRLGIVELTADFVVTVVLSRVCGARACPAPGGDPEATQCVGGVCVPPGCFPETPELCPTSCQSDDQCPDEGCGAGVCVDAFCQLERDVSLCPSMVCSDDLVCEPLPPPPAPDCTNGIQDGMETGVDCGGADCPGCGPGGITVAGLLQWYDFSDAATLFSDQAGMVAATPGGTIGRVRDKGPLGLDMVSGADANAPTYVAGGGASYADFDGRNDRLAATISGGAANLRDTSFFIIYRIDRRQHDEMLLHYTGNDDSENRNGALRVSGIENATANRLRSYFSERDTDGTLFNSWYINDATTRLLEFSLESSPPRARAWDFDRVLFDDPALAFDHTPARFVLGARWNGGYSDELECRIYEYIAYDRGLTPEERALLVAYLNGKYGFNL